MLKKSISILLVAIMLIASVVTAGAAESATQSVDLEIVNESAFAWGDAITFTITITNNTDSRIANVNLRSEPKGMSKYFTISEDSAKTINFITPGATRKVDLIYTSQSISNVQSFFRSILTLFKQIFARFSRNYTYIKTLRVGRSTVLFGIDVEYEPSSVVSTGEINLDDPDPDVEIYSFSADTLDILVGEQKSVVFSSVIYENIELDTSDVSVVNENNEVITYLKDDGIAPDTRENDGIFTARATMSSNVRKNEKYYAKYANCVSDSIEICYYTNISRTDYSSVYDMMNHVYSLTSLQSVVAYVSTSSLIDSYFVNDSQKSISFTSTCGISGFWEEESSSGVKGNKTPKYENDDYSLYDLSESAEAAQNDSVVTAKNKNVVVIRPFENDVMFTEVSGNVGSRIATALGGTCSLIDNGNVTVDFMKTLDNYGTVIVDSHGTLASFSQSVAGTQGEDPYMLIGETLSSSNMFSSADWQSSRIVVSGSRRIAVGGRFFERYYENKTFKDTVFYLGTCYSMHNDTISASLISRGASAVYGFSEPVGFTYCDNVLTEVFTSLITDKENVDQAYTAAGDRYGYFSSNNCEFRYVSAFPFSYFSNDKGTISGVIKNASTSSVVSNALIRIYKDDALIASTRTSSNGSYSVSVPSGNYIVKVSAGGFKTAKMAVTVRTNATTYNETFLLIFSGIGTGFANGNTINAITGQLLPDVRINIRSSWNNFEGEIVETISSNTNGYYDVSLPAGLYTFECYKDGYITTYKNIVVLSIDFITQNISIAPELEEGYYRVVLTWGVNPHDLDSHLFGKTSDYSYHVYFGDKNGYGLNDTLVANLDVDDTTSYGPETTTFYTTSDGEYDFYIDWFSGSGTWANSGGKVEVYNGAYLINTYFVPNANNSSGSWKVFSIKNGVYTDYNVMTEDIY